MKAIDATLLQSKMRESVGGRRQANQSFPSSRREIDFQLLPEATLNNQSGILPPPQHPVSGQAFVPNKIGFGFHLRTMSFS